MPLTQAVTDALEARPFLRQMDITAPEGDIQIQIRSDGKVLWVHVEGQTVLRICCITGHIDIQDDREGTGAPIFGQTKSLANALDSATVLAKKFRIVYYIGRDANGVAAYALEPGRLVEIWHAAFADGSHNSYGRARKPEEWRQL